MIDVWCVCVGDKYTKQHVLNLYHMVKKHLSSAFFMYCLTDRRDILDDLDLPFFPVEDAHHLPGWWSKMALFELAKRPSIYFDLDVVITGSLEPLLEYTKSDLAMPKNWGRSGHGGFQSSVMCWSGRARRVFMQFQPEKIASPEEGNYGYYIEDNGIKQWGDQEYLSYHHADQITEIPAGKIVSYKYHAVSGVPKDASVVCFHGKPKYTEVNHDWIRQAIS